MRFDGVHALRFVAALLVLVTHATFFAAERLDPSGATWWFGAVGVDIFFVVSGFVMIVSTTRLTRDGTGALQFGYRRVIRIAPMYWLATTVKILTVLVVPAVALHPDTSVGRVLASYFFLPTRGPDGETGVILGVGWTLLFEMLFYVLFSIGLALRMDPMVFSGGLLGALAVGSLLRPDTDWPVWAYHADPIVLYFVIGMALGRMALSPRAGPRAPWVAAGTVVTCLVIAVIPGGVAWGHSSPFRVACVTTLVTCVVAAEPLLRRRVPQPVPFLADASYTLYLFHPLVGPLVPVALAYAGVTDMTLATVLTVALCMGAASAAHVLVERPLTARLRNGEPRFVALLTRRGRPEHVERPAASPGGTRAPADGRPPQEPDAPVHPGTAPATT